MLFRQVIVIFLLSGAGLKTKVLLDAAASWRLHLLTQTVSLVFLPLLGFGLSSALWRTRLNKQLVSGIAVCLSTSTTASTNVVFTKTAGGNEALALVNAVLGNLIGIFITPAWLETFLGSKTGHVPYAKVIQLLACTVIAPLVVGNAAQYGFPARVAWLKTKMDFGKAGSFCILLLVWSTFSNTFAKHVKVDAASIIAVAALMLGVYLLSTFLTFFALLLPAPARLLRASERDAVAVAMCAGTKTVALGIPIITALYEGNPAVGLLSLPLIIYHALQILFGSVITAPIKRFVEAKVAAREAAAAAAKATEDEVELEGEAAGEVEPSPV